MYYNRIDLSEEIDFVKSNSSKEYIICCCWLFNHGFKFQDLFNGFHDLTMLCLNISDIAVIKVKGVDCH